jgi:hypothetical protein
MSVAPLGRPEPHHNLRSEERRHLYHRGSQGRRRVAGDQRAGSRVKMRGAVFVKKINTDTKREDCT